MKIEIFSDIICPWCFIGKQRLDRVLTTEIGENVELRWRPYLLYPNLPLEGVDRAELLKRRYGEDADPGRIPERIRMEAEEEALTLRFDLIKRTPNTLLAHRLMEFAYDADPTGQLQHQLSERLFRAYFCEGQDVGDFDTLIQQAHAVGLAQAEATEYLAGEQGVDHIVSTPSKERSRAKQPWFYIIHCANCGYVYNTISKHTFSQPVSPKFVLPD